MALLFPPFFVRHARIFSMVNDKKRAIGNCRNTSSRRTSSIDRLLCIQKFYREFVGVVTLPPKSDPI